MVITFLGTGTSQGIPCIGCECAVCRSLDVHDKRLRTSLHIAVDKHSFVIDTGPDFRQQILRANIKTLDAVLFTHQHKDHTAGLDDIRGFNFKQKKAMPIYGRQSVIKQLQSEFAYIFDEETYHYESLPRVNAHVINGAPFEIGRLRIQPIELLHARLPVFGFRIGDFCYLTDVNYISKESQTHLKGAHTIVLSALRKEKHPSHFSLKEACALLKKWAPKAAYLTHISHLMGRHKDVSRELPKGIQIAYDGLKIEIPDPT